MWSLFVIILRILEETGESISVSENTTVDDKLIKNILYQNTYWSLIKENGIKLS